MYWVAHRGESYDAPENTMAAFNLAWTRGMKFIEGDFHLTRDGRIVCSHDASTGRACGVDLKIAETDYAELRRLDFAGEPIPSLEEVLDSIPQDGGILLEIKSGPEILEPLRAVVSRRNPGQIVFICFDAELLRRAKRLMPEFKTLLLIGDMPQGGADALLRTLDEIGAAGVDACAKPELLTREVVGTLLAVGKEVHVWTVDEEPLAEYFIGCGVTAITSNRAAFLSVRNRCG